MWYFRGCFDNYRTADAVARLRFASLHLQVFELQLVAMTKATGRISPSLLQHIPEKRSKDAHKRFKLGMGLEPSQTAVVRRRTRRTLCHAGRKRSS